GEVGGDAGLEQGLAREQVALGVGGEEVDAGESVHLEVDEAGGRDSAAVRRGESEAGDAPSEDLDVAGNDRSVDQCALDAEPHDDVSNACAMLRPESSSRCLAVAASTPATSATIATRASPSASASAASMSAEDAPVAVATIRRTRSTSFSFAAAT